MAKPETSIDVIVTITTRRAVLLFFVALIGGALGAAIGAWWVSCAL